MCSVVPLLIAEESLRSTEASPRCEKRWEATGLELRAGGTAGGLHPSSVPMSDAQRRTGEKSLVTACQDDSSLFAEKLPLQRALLAPSSRPLDEF